MLIFSGKHLMFHFKTTLLASLALGGALMASPSWAQTKTLSGLATGWTQNAPYNAGLPASPTGVPARVGSAALALAQVLRFNGAKYDFPPTGLKSHTDVDKNPDVVGSFAANYAATSYPWSKLPSSIKAPDANVSTLLLHAGIGVDTDYGTQGSYLPRFGPKYGYAKPADAVKVAQSALTSYFGYSGGKILSNTATDGVLPQASLDAIKAEINAGYPVIAALTGQSGGQFATIYGYNGNKFVFLFGLGGGDGSYEFGKIAVKYKEGTQALVGTFNGPAAFLIGQRPPLAPSISIGDATVVEGNTGTVKLRFPVTLSKATSFPLTVALKTSKGTATPKTDYTEASANVVIPAKKSSVYFEVPVVGDLTVENNETLFATLTAGKLPVTRAKATGTIQDDDTSASVADVSVPEGNTGETPALITLKLAKAVPFSAKFSYVSQAGTATEGTDYKAAQGTIVVPAKATQVTVPLAILGDTKREENETFTVKFTPASGVALTRDTATVTILDDDSLLSVSDPVVVETDAGQPTADFVLSLDRASASPITVSYATQDGTAIAVDDYIGTKGTVTFAPGELTKTVSVPVTGDKREESDETFTLLVASDQADIAKQGTATIRDDDASLVVTPSVSVTEGQVTPAISVALSRSLTVPVDVKYATADSGATAGSDYTAASGTLTFAPGEGAKTLSFQTLDDTTGEGTEPFVVNFNSPFLEESAQTVVNILDNDAALSIQPVSQVEGNTQARNVNFTIQLSNSYSKRVTVAYKTVDGTAIGGADYATASGSVVFEPGETVKTISIATIPDTTPESDETFSIQLSSSDLTVPSNAVVGTILDDDFTLSMADVTVNEGNSGSTLATFTVKMSKALSFPIDVNFATTEGTAKYTTDFDQKNINLTFAAGETQKTVDVVVFGDTTDEDNEAFSVTAATNYYFNGYYYDIAQSVTATGTIVDDDDPKFPLTGRIVFSAQMTNGYFDIYTSNPNGTNLTRLTFTDDASETRPILSPDGTKIAFQEGSSIFIMDADGRNPRAVASNYNSDYRFSPDGTKLIYSNSDSNIAVVGIDGTGAVELTANNNSAVPQFSPDGTKILYESRASGATELYVMTAAGRTQTRLTRNGGSNGRWSPDGTKVVFQASDGDNEIFVINADGSAQTQLTVNTTGDSFPRWNADGTLVIFVSTRTGSNGIYSMAADGTKQTLLVADAYLRTDQEIVLSPNGGYIAYTSYNSSYSQTGIRLLELTVGAQPRELPTASFTAAQEPNWGANTVPTPPTGLPVGALTGKIVYDVSGGVKVRNADGSKPTTLNTNGYAPIFTPDGSNILYRANNGLYITDARGSVTNSIAASAYPSGYVGNTANTRVYYGDDVSSTIKVGDLATGNTSELLPKPTDPDSNGASNTFPILTPNEANVVFQTYHAVYVPDGDYYQYQNDIAVVPVAGGQVTYLTNDNRNALYDINRANGRIAFVHYDSNLNKYQVTLMSADGANRQVVLTLDGSVQNIRFSPDGTKVAVVSNGKVYEGVADGSLLSAIFSGSARSLRFDPTNTRLGVSCDNGFWVMKPDGTDVIRLTNVGNFDWKAGTVTAAGVSRQGTCARESAPRFSFGWQFVS